MTYNYAYKTPLGKLITIIAEKENNRFLCDDGWIYEKSELIPASLEECNKKWGETFVLRQMLQAFMDREC